jgi:hypothetical protein
MIWGFPQLELSEDWEKEDYSKDASIGRLYCDFRHHSPGVSGESNNAAKQDDTTEALAEEFRTYIFPGALSNGIGRIAQFGY